MDQAILFEIIGYIASALVAISLMMSSILRLRLINVVGSLFFVVYGLLIGSLPVVLTNGFITVINLYYLYQLMNVEDEFKILETEHDSDYLQMFLDYHREDIETYYPHFFTTPYEKDEPKLVFFVLRNMQPVGVFIGRRGDDQSLVVKLDYVIPGYRDFQVGDFLFHQKRDVFRERGYKRLLSYPGNRQHQQYLERMGFEQNYPTSDKRLYMLEL